MELYYLVIREYYNPFWGKPLANHLLPSGKPT